MESIFTKFLQFSRQFQQFYGQSFQPLMQEGALSMREINILLFLGNNPAFDTARDITELRNIPKSQVSQAVDLLVTKGFLTRKPDASDRRIIHLELTPTGQETAQRGQTIQSACFQQILDGLQPEERQTFLHLADKILSHPPISAPAKGGSDT